jgi:hypothetical protein
VNSAIPYSAASIKDGAPGRQPVEAVEFENKRNRSSGITGGPGPARHVANATREFEIDWAD